MIKMLNKIGISMDEHSEKFNKELENIKKNQTALKCNNWNKKYTRGINGRLHDTKEHNSDLEDREAKIIQAEQKVEFFFFLLWG